MSKGLIKDTLRTIRTTMAKFITLFAIVALGVAFFVGVSAGAPIMSASVDTYNDENALMDFQIYSTFGFEENDITALEKVAGIEKVAGNKFVDVEGHFGSSNLLIRLQSYQENQKVNRFVLKEGRLPQNENECLAEKGGAMRLLLPLGAEVELRRPEDDVDDYLSVDKITVVGLVDTPEYLNEEKGNSTLSNRAIQTYVFVPESTFTTDYYTSVYLVAEGAIDFNGFSDAYFDFVDPIEQRIDTLAITQESVRRDRIVAEAQTKYDEGLLEYEDGKNEFDTEIANAQTEIVKAQKKITDGEQEIKDNEVKLEEETAKALTDLDAAQYELESSFANWKVEKSKFESETKPALEAQKGTLASQKSMLQPVMDRVLYLNGEIQVFQDEKTALESELNALDTSDPDYATKQAEYNQKIAAKQVEITTKESEKTDTLITIGMPDEATLSGTLNQLQSGIDQITEGIAQGETKIVEAKTQLDTGYGQVYAGRLELETTKVDALQKIADAKVDIAKGKVKLKDARSTLEVEKEKGQKKLDDAWTDLVKAEDEISSIESAEWTVLNRELHYASKTFGDTIVQMRSIASIFPVFFFLVSALVCLTTMTRMVDEQRGQIGVLRALGYGKFACASKYLVYASVATILGGIVGSIIGLIVFPFVIYNAWMMMYVLPPMTLVIPWDLVGFANLLFLTVMCATTWIACRNSMNEVPCQLLRPKSPAMGKKIMLERIPFLWKKFSFTSKVTARNIIRYKKRFLMTVIGIAGCTALLVAGFGIRDSISTIVDKQFVEIYKYDGFVNLESDLVQSEITGIESELQSNEQIKKTLQLSSYSGKVVVGSKEHVATVSVYPNNDELHSMNVIRHRKDNKPIQLMDEGVIINEKLAELLDVQIGDTISLESENEIMKEVVVTDICEMYLNHSVFITSQGYENLYSIKAKINTIIVQIDEDSEELQQQVSRIEGVDSLNFYKGIIANFDDMLGGLGVVTLVLIVCAGLLAFVVLSNLTNVNISERQREIATLKVLGFNRKEVNAYIYKENLILTFIGSLVGLGLGIVLHKFIILMVEMDFIMFGRDVSPLSLLLSVLITMSFALVVNAFMTFKLRKIQMVESLKSVE